MEVTTTEKDKFVAFEADMIAGKLIPASPLASVAAIRDLLHKVLPLMRKHKIKVTSKFVLGDSRLISASAHHSIVRALIAEWKELNPIQKPKKPIDKYIEYLQSLLTKAKISFKPFDETFDQEGQSTSQAEVVEEES